MLGGVIRRHFCHKFLKSKAVNFVGVQSKAGQPRVGVELGPQAMRDAGLHKIMEDL